MKINKRLAIRIVLSVVALAIMALVADILGQREVIFPEIAALAVGLWIADKRMWDVSDYEIPLLMTVSAVLGVAITSWLNVNIFVQLTLAFLPQFGIRITTKRVVLSCQYKALAKHQVCCRRSNKQLKQKLG